MYIILSATILCELIATVHTKSPVGNLGIAPVCEVAGMGIPGLGPIARGSATMRGSPIILGSRISGLTPGPPIGGCIGPPMGACPGPVTGMDPGCPGIPMLGPGPPGMPIFGPKKISIKIYKMKS